MSLHFQSSIVKEVTIQENVKTDLISGYLGAEITGINLAAPPPLQIDYINKDFPVFWNILQMRF